MKKIFYLFIVILLNSCLLQTDEVDFKLNETDEEFLVVEGAITNELKQHVVKLALSGKFYGDTDYPPAIGAVVTISDGTTIYDLEETEEGIYNAVMALDQRS